jgi:hypothetical protein
MDRSSPRLLAVALAFLIAGALVAVALAQTGGGGAATTMTHDTSHTEPLGSDVMPFDVERSTHLFSRLEDGGVQLVVTDDPSDREQVSLIRSHLRKERRRFSRGDFSDPTTIHGHRMPGLAAIKRRYRQITVAYRPRANGAALRYRTQRRRIVSALHKWFAAQVHDHAPYADLR